MNPHIKLELYATLQVLMPSRG